MVVKTDLCQYTEYKIYPGRGQKFVAKDGKTTFFLTAKVDSLYHQKIKPVKLTWTQAWRRMNKKGKVESSSRKGKKKAARFQKAIVGMSVADIARMKKQKTELRSAAEDAKLKEAKARQEKKKSKPAVKPGGGQPKGAPSKNAGKQQKSG